MIETLEKVDIQPNVYRFKTKREAYRFRNKNRNKRYLKVVKKDNHYYLMIKVNGKYLGLCEKIAQN